jgi:hypothetical protein
MFGSNNLSIKGESPPIVGNDPGYDPHDDELSNDNTKKKFTNIIQCSTDLCDFCSHSLMVEYITNKAWSTLTDVNKIMVERLTIFASTTRSDSSK